MKKTFFALALLGALNLAHGQDSVDEQNVADLQDAVSLTFSNAANTSEGHISTGYGFVFTLGNNLDIDRVATTAYQGGHELPTVPTFSAVELTSITFKTYGNSWSSNTTKAYIADQATKTVVAISGTIIPTTVQSGDEVKLEFGNVTLSSNTVYVLKFTNGNVTIPDVGESAIANNNGVLYSNGRGFATIGNSLDSSTSSELGFAGTKGEVLSYAYSPIVTIQATVKNVPEPSAAALGLLALGGLAARRRRK